MFKWTYLKINSVLMLLRLDKDDVYSENENEKETNREKDDEESETTKRVRRRNRECKYIGQKVYL